MQKPTLPKGTRDFGPEQMLQRNYIFDTIKKTFQTYGFLPIETPSLENLSVLTGKYGDEGDQLLFKVLNSGDFLSKTTEGDYNNGSKHLTSKISEKGLRYDLTVPFARHVVMNQHAITFPFKRYQIQPVWRADRPQKGRYREFYQCDADVIGTKSLLCEAEIIMMINDVFDALKLSDFVIKVNNRKVLNGMIERVDAIGREGDFCVAIDKLDKIGKEKVLEELSQKGFSAENLAVLSPIFDFQGSNQELIAYLKVFLETSEIGMEGVQEMELLANYASSYGKDNLRYEFDMTLARGLSYYTGTIFEVKPTSVEMGSICGGGRYDDLTGVFGLKDVSGVGISFGIERIYDVLLELGLFPSSNQSSVQLLITNFGEETIGHCLEILRSLRTMGLNAEVYPDSVKMKKQLNYANKREIPFALMVGTDEMTSKSYTLKDMDSGEQYQGNMQEVYDIIKDK